MKETVARRRGLPGKRHLQQLRKPQ